MKNKQFEIQHLREKLFRHDALEQLAEVWKTLIETGSYVIPANGGWVHGTFRYQ